MTSFRLIDKSDSMEVEQIEIPTAERDSLLETKTPPVRANKLDNTPTEIKPQWPEETRDRGKGTYSTSHTW